MSEYRLHEIEAALEISTDEPITFRPVELYNLEEEHRRTLALYNIYLIGRRARLSLNPRSLELDPTTNSISGTIDAHVGERKEPFYFKAAIPPYYKIEQLGVHQFPFDNLRLLTRGRDGGLAPYQISLSHMLPLCEQDFPPSFTDMQVDYVGKGFGDEGERDAFDRLIGDNRKKGHEALQRILAVANASCPDQEVHVIFCNFRTQRRVVLGGGFEGTPAPKESNEDTLERLRLFFNCEFTPKTRIDLAEAALIRHFAPWCNVYYKETFPGQTHKILDRLRELDFTGLATGLSTKRLGIRLYSEGVGPDHDHLARHSIREDEERMSFFDIAFPPTREGRHPVR